MSKIGKINIAIPEKVKVVLTGNNLNIEGPQGKKSVNIDLEVFNLDIKDLKPFFLFNYIFYQSFFINFFLIKQLYF